MVSLPTSKVYKTSNKGQLRIIISSDRTRIGYRNTISLATMKRFPQDHVDSSFVYDKQSKIHFCFAIFPLDVIHICHD